METATFSQSPTALLRVHKGFDLRHVDPGSTPGFTGDKDAGKELLDREDEQLTELQEKLFAQSRFGARESVLLVLQAMDTGGKGGIVRRSPRHPSQGVQSADGGRTVQGLPVAGRKRAAGPRDHRGLRPLAL
jgi:hypothetical protein